LIEWYRTIVAEVTADVLARAEAEGRPCGSLLTPAPEAVWIVLALVPNQRESIRREPGAARYARNSSHNMWEI
jgi:hypothetical protein